jgi:glutaredoxin
VDYRNVEVNPQDLEEMLRYSQGKRAVPVILLRNEVKVGYGGT